VLGTFFKENKARFVGRKLKAGERRGRARKTTNLAAHEPNGRRERVNEKRFKKKMEKKKAASLWMTSSTILRGKRRPFSATRFSPARVYVSTFSPSQRLSKKRKAKRENAEMGQQAREKKPSQKGQQTQQHRGGKNAQQQHKGKGEKKQKGQPKEKPNDEENSRENLITQALVVADSFDFPMSPITR
jgi:hypothetical protein